MEETELDRVPGEAEWTAERGDGEGPGCVTWEVLWVWVVAGGGFGWDVVPTVAVAAAVVVGVCIGVVLLEEEVPCNGVGALRRVERVP